LIQAQLADDFISLALEEFLSCDITVGVISLLDALWINREEKDQQS
jgi:hypothetical protein